MGIKIWRVEKYPFDEISLKLFIRRMVFLLIESRVFHIDGARFFGFEFINVIFE